MDDVHSDSLTEARPLRAREFDARDVGAVRDWLIGEARQSNDAVTIVAGFCERLVGLGIPLSRMRVAQRLANPVDAAWGVIWNAPDRTEVYTVSRTMLEGPAWHGSPFQYVTTRRKPYRKRLNLLFRGRDPEVLFEFAADGATDYFAMPLPYGDGSVQGLAFTTDDPRGFADAALDVLKDLAVALGAALEPMAMRRSMASLLRTYLGDGPAGAVLRGANRRGDRTRITAALLLTDIRGFTDFARTRSSERLFALLDDYFGAVAASVYAQGGDVLKFMGDAMLSIFPASEDDEVPACARAVRALAAARKAFAELDGGNPDFVAALHLGEVDYGNVGSPERLDFTVIGPAVNLVSRLEGVAKETGGCAIASRAFVESCDVNSRPVGARRLKGIDEAVDLFALDLD